MKKLAFSVFGLILCLSLCACGKARDYEAAVAMMEAEDYVRAIEIFSELGDYEQSQEKVSFCKMNAYTKAQKLLSEYAYDEAYVIFAVLGDYDDSKEIVEDWAEVITYMEAGRYYEMGEYAESYALYTELGEYVKALPLLESVDAEYQVEQCKEHIYNQAMALYDKGRYEDAQSLFAVLDDYNNSEEMAELCVKIPAYARAMELYETGAYQTAQAAFLELGKYEDSAEMVEECQKAIEDELLYEKAVVLVEAGQYAEAMDVFEEMYNPYKCKDAREYMELCRKELMLADALFAELERIMGIDSLEEKIEKGGIYNGGTGIGDARQLWCNINTHQALKPPYVFEMGDGTKLQIPMTYGALHEAGWRVQEEAYWSNFDFRGAELDDLFPANERNYLDMVNREGNVIRIRVENDTAEATELRNASIMWFHVGADYTETISNDGKWKGKKAEYFLVNGITKGSEMDTLLKAFGLPYRVEYTVYSEELKDLVFEYWKNPEDSGGHLSVNVDADTGKVTSIAYEMEPLVHHW